MSAITEPQSFHGHWNSESLQVVTFVTLSWYNSVELILILFTTFKEWRSLYFVSLLVATVGIIPYCVGFLCEYFHFMPFWLSMAFSSIGWAMMITGQAFVLYSRLGLILTNKRILKAVKWMIIIDAVVFHTSITVVQYGTRYGDEQDHFTRALFYMEKIQMTAFCIQEFIISGLYLWKSVELLRVIAKEGTKRVMRELFIINILIIAMDIVLLAMEYSGLRTQERAIKSFIYSVKLKLEFAILGKLVDLVQSSQRAMSTALDDVPSFVDVTKTRSHQQPNRRRSQVEDMPDWLLKLEEKDVQHIEHAQIDLNGSLK